MSDIDFDELDREVKKLVNTDDPQVEKDTFSDVSSVDTEKENSTSTTLSSEAGNGTDKTDTETIDEQKPAKPRGRFMDVVHPSSDMAAGDEELGARLTSQNDRKSLTPVHEAEDVRSEEDESLNDGLTADPTSLPDLHEEEKKDTDKTEDTSETPAEVSEPTELDVPSSAFLADAKVEKRPLGQHSDAAVDAATDKTDSGPDTQKAPSYVSAVDDIAQKAIDEANGKTDDGEEKPPVEENVPLPPELEKDLVAIEAGESPDDILSGTLEDGEAKKEEATESKDESDDKEVDDKKEDDKALKSDSATTSLLSSGSIPQQYKIAMQQKTGDSETKQLFAAEHYTTTPAKSAKKGASTFATIMQWFFIVVGVLLLGAVIGAGLYTFVSNQ